MTIAAGIILGCAAGSRTVSVFAENCRAGQRLTFVIDPGHGGVDGGATSWDGKLESGYNLEIALRLRDLFHLLGYQTRMIRTTDTSIHTKGETIAAQKLSDLKERVRIANEIPNSILISIHQNTFSDSRYFGAQVFYAKTQGSQELAKHLQTSLVASLNPGSKRVAKQASEIYLMEHIQVPGILVECGFLSNPEESARLETCEYQKQLCCVIASAATEFVERGYANT